MASLEAMKFPGSGTAAAAAGAMLNGEVMGRVLRSHSAKATQPISKLVDAKIAFKAKKKKKDSVIVDSKELENPKSNGKRESGAVVDSVAVVVVEESVVGVAKQGKRARKTTTGTKKSVVVEMKAGGGSEVSLTGVQSWGVSLSTAEAMAEATKHLVAADGKMREVIEAHGGAAPVWEHKGDGFSALARAIVYQQLAGKAADTIYGRLIDLCGGPEGVAPATIASFSAEQLRTAGISARKAIYLHDLAEKFTSGFLSDEKLAVLSEDDLVTALTAVKGIGVWSAHMFMIFFLHKPDVLPVGDLGIRKGFQKLFQMKQQPSAAEMEALASPWQPYRSLASWYLWRLNDIKLPDS